MSQQAIEVRKASTVMMHVEAGASIQSPFSSFKFAFRIGLNM